MLWQRGKCTPNIDRIAAEGVRFANCYAPPVCAPSRVQLLTGRYPFRTGWYLHHDAAFYRGGGFDWKRETSVARVLRDAGYVTGMAGKWQVNHLYDEPDAIRQHGFQESLVWPGSIEHLDDNPAKRARFEHAIRENDSTYLREATRDVESRYWDPVVMKDGRREVRKGKFGPDEFQKFAFDFMARHRNRPFFLYHSMVLAHRTGHGVNTTPENKDNPPPDERAAFAGLVRYADRQVAELIAELARLGLRDNTIVIIASDNGTERSISGRRNGLMVKGGIYSVSEAGGNVALVVHSPKLVPGNRVASLCDFSDIFPTLCAFARTPIPADLVLDGRSQAEYLLEKAEPPRKWIFNQYRPDRVVRDARFKLYSDGRFFDANRDWLEQRPIAPGADPVSDESRRQLQAVMSSLPADVPAPFPHRSISAFNQRKAEGKKQTR